MNIVEELKKLIQEMGQAEKKKRDRLDSLIQQYATIGKSGFQINIETATDEWDSQ